jgi:type IV pilus assembly protein PilV
MKHLRTRDIYSLDVRTRNGQRGVTLIEALVALLVLSIGLLGVAGLQMVALRNNHGAHLRSQATVLAYDIADRMRANRAAALAGDYDVAVGGTIAGATLAAIDVQTWKQTLSGVLPGGDGSLARNGNVVRIQIQWRDRFGSGVFVTETFTTQTQI